MDLTIRIAGAAGQGVETTGDLLVEVFADQGIHCLSTQTYMSRIRGGVNSYDVRISDREIFSGRERADMLIALNEKTLNWFSEKLTEDGIALYSGADKGADQSKVIAIDLEKVATEVGGSAIMANIVAAGAIFSIVGHDIGSLEDHIRSHFQHKGKGIVNANIACARKGAELVGEHAGRLNAPIHGDAPTGICSGNEAVGLAAATAGIKFATGYPMTPSTGVLTYLANAADKYGLVVEQAEDEIAAINMICGATYAGVPAMTTTSGGGFALMVEGISLAGMLELPIFVFLGQRPGPATGLPTRTAQQDLLFAVHAGHGEFPRAVFAPGTPQQCYDLTRHGIEIAHKHQSPVILISDQFLADVRKNCPGLDDTYRPVDRHIVENPPEDYLRYAVTESGLSPRALPGSSAFVVLDSDEHDEDGHITDHIPTRVKMQDKRMRKYAGLLEDLIRPQWYGPEDAGHVLVTWGSAYGPCREAVDYLVHTDESIAMLHFAQLWPLDGAAIADMIGDRHVTVVECNQTGQLGRLLRQVGALADFALMGKYDGLPFTADEIIRRIQ